MLEKLSTIATMISIIAVGLVIGLYESFVLTLLWRWFIVPFGVVQIGLFWMCGLWTFVRFITMDAYVTRTESEWYIKATVSGIIATIVLLVGFIYHLLM